MAKTKNKHKDKETVSSINKTAIFVLLAIISFAVYYNSLSNQFVFDDESVVLSDPSIMSLSNIPKYFTGEQGFHKVIGRYFRPVVSASYAFDYAIWEFKPFGFHLTNVLIHVINVLLFYALLRLMFEKYESRFKDYAVLIGALIFALHPIHTEAVAWVSGRTDSLSCTFFIAAFLYYLKYSKENKNQYISLTLIFYFLSLLAKEMAITFPVVIILYDILTGKISIKQAFKEKALIYSSLILLSVVYLIYRWAVLHNTPQRETYFYFYNRDIVTTIFTMLPALPLYFRLSVVPYGMLYHYSGYMPYISNPFVFPVIFSVIFLAVICFVSFYFYKRQPFITYALLFFFITLSPVLNIVPTMNLMADRFLYQPSIFLSLIAIAVILKYYSEKRVNIIYGIAGVVLISYGYMTIERNADWKTNDTLFLSAEGRPGTVTYVNIGNIYANRGDYNKAEEYFRMALALREEQVMSNNNLGKIFIVRNNFDSAYHYLYRAYELDTLSPEPMHALAQLYARYDSIPKAIDWLERIQKVTPGYMNSDKMLQEMKMSRQLDPSRQNDLAPQDNNLNSEERNKITILEKNSYTNYQNKNYAAAIEQLNELIKLNPSMASGYYNNIGMCFLDQEKYLDAAKNFEKSVELGKDFSTGYNNLGQCYEKMGDKKKAAEYYQKAVDADPGNLVAKENLEKVK